ncbi:hypothetical protein GFS31_43270 (plasmid) [Leptolyngbya sp. BL0902]|nr:hypothetical protein GFS31_43270 [Leptolyngbya sp. BL0902]
MPPIALQDVYSPAVLSVEQIVQQLRPGIDHLPIDQTWINSGCGSKTRRWDEVVPALKNMVVVTQKLRGEIQNAVTDSWQSRNTPWQGAFIRENLLPLGHGAWRGYKTQGRGLVVCEIMAADVTTLNWRRDVVRYRIRYQPAAALESYLRPYGLPSTAMDGLREVVQTYRPSQELLLVLRSSDQVEMNWLRNWAIAPPDCYRQVCNRWDEFDLGATPRRRGCRDAKG